MASAASEAGFLYTAAVVSVVYAAASDRENPLAYNWNVPDIAAVLLATYVLRRVV